MTHYNYAIAGIFEKSEMWQRTSWDKISYVMSEPFDPNHLVTAFMKDGTQHKDWNPTRADTIADDWVQLIR